MMLVEISAPAKTYSIHRNPQKLWICLHFKGTFAYLVCVFYIFRALFLGCIEFCSVEFARVSGELSMTSPLFGFYLFTFLFFYLKILIPCVLAFIFLSFVVKFLLFTFFFAWVPAHGVDWNHGAVSRLP